MQMYIEQSIILKYVLLFVANDSLFLSNIWIVFSNY
jgi:hypothetical protein